MCGFISFKINIHRSNLLLALEIVLTIFRFRYTCSLDISPQCFFVFFSNSMLSRLEFLECQIKKEFISFFLATKCSIFIRLIQLNMFHKFFNGARSYIQVVPRRSILISVCRASFCFYDSFHSAMIMYTFSIPPRRIMSIVIIFIVPST